MIILDCKTSDSGAGISQLAYLKLDRGRITAKNYCFTEGAFCKTAPLLRQDFLPREYLIGHDILKSVSILRAGFYQWPATPDTYCTMRQAVNRAGLVDGKLPRLAELLAALEITPAAVDIWAAALYPDMAGAGPHDSRWRVAAICCVLFVLADQHRESLPPELAEIKDYALARGGHFDPRDPDRFVTEEICKARSREKKRLKNQGKTFFDLTGQEIDAIVKSAAASAVARTHAAGRFSTHGDEKGVYRLYPDGRKEYIEPIRVSVREAIHSVAMECGPFTPEELADLEKISSGEITVEQSIQIEYDRLEKMYDEHPEKFVEMPDFLKEKRKKRRK